MTRPRRSGGILLQPSESQRDYTERATAFNRSLERFPQQRNADHETRSGESARADSGVNRRAQPGGDPYVQKLCVILAPFFQVACHLLAHQLGCLEQPVLGSLV